MARKAFDQGARAELAAGGGSVAPWFPSAYQGRFACRTIGPMRERNRDPTRIEPSANRFLTTRWSLLLAARGDGETAAAAQHGDDAVPATPVKSGGMREEKRRPFAGPIPHRQFQSIHSNSSSFRNDHLRAIMISRATILWGSHSWLPPPFRRRAFVRGSIPTQNAA